MITKEQLYKGLKETTGLPVAYHHFDKPPTIPFIAYYEEQKFRYEADNKNYYTEPRYRIELYHVERTDDIKAKIEQYLNTLDVVWVDDEEIYIDQEELYMKAYSI